MKFNAISRVIFSRCLPLICLAGCQSVVPVEIKSLTPPEKKAQGVLLVGDLARSVRKETPDVIGYHTITFFAIKDFNCRIMVIISFNIPFKTKASQRRGLYYKLTAFDPIRHE